jgi:hypothetical protein
VFERLRQARRGVRGGGTRPPPQGGGAPRAGVWGQHPRIFFFSGRHIFGTTYFRDDIFPGRHIIGTTYFWDHMILGGFSAHGFLPMVFYFRLRN